MPPHSKKPRCPVTPLTAEQQALAAAHVGFASEIAARVARKCPRAAEEVECAAYYGLVRAAQKFRPARGVLFATFATIVIRGAVIDAARRALPLGYNRPDGLARRTNGGAVCRVFSISAPLEPGRGLSSYSFWSDETQNPTLEKAIASAEDAPDSGATFTDLVTGLTRRFARPERDIVRAYFLRAGATMKDIAMEYGFSESRVSQIVTNALAALRDDLADDPRYAAEANVCPGTKLFPNPCRPSASGRRTPPRKRRRSSAVT